MKRNFQLLKLLLKFGMPVSVAGFFLMPLYGHFNPWPPAAELSQAYPGQSAILVESSYYASHTPDNNTVNKSRSYILFPSVFYAPKTITVTQINSEPPTIDEFKYGVLLHGLSFVFCVFGTWWFWFRKGSSVQQGIQPDGPASGGSAS